MICLKHQQQYNEGEYCIYCGNPKGGGQTVPSPTKNTDKIQSKAPDIKWENPLAHNISHIHGDKIITHENLHTHDAEQLKNLNTPKR